MVIPRESRGRGQGGGGKGERSPLLPFAPTSGLLSFGPGRVFSSGYFVTPYQTTLSPCFLGLGCYGSADGGDGNLNSCP